MLIQDFIVKEKKVSGLHKDLCEDCKRVEYLYRNLPGYKSNLVFWVAKPCQSIVKKPRPVVRSEEETTLGHEFFSFLKKVGSLKVQKGTDSKENEVFVLSRNTTAVK